MPDLARTPNLFLIGGMRCGSTTLNLLLDQHPDIFMSGVKEPLYYVVESLRRLEAPTAEEQESSSLCIALCRCG